jgi:porin
MPKPPLKSSMGADDVYVVHFRTNTQTENASMNVDRKSEKNEVRIARWLLTSGLITCALAGTASAQETVASVEANAELGPIDTPGRPIEPRSKRDMAEARGEADATIDAGRDAATREWAGGKSWWNWDRATGDWGGIRTNLEAKGLSIAGTLLTDIGGPFDGGITNRVSSRRWFSANATLDLAKLTNDAWKGGKAFIDYQHYAGRLVNDVGDLQSYDSIATDRHRDQIAELWFEQRLFKELLRVKFGKVDANREFNALTSASSFIHSSGAYNTNILGFPTYPDPALGVVAFIYPTPWLYAGFGFFDGATRDGFRTGSRAGFDTFFDNDKSDGNFYIGELGFTWPEVGGLGKGLRAGKGKVAGGVWHHTDDFAMFSGGLQDGATGGYLIGEQQLYRPWYVQPETDGGLWLLARANFAPDDVAAIKTQVSAGLTFRGPFESRLRDEVGFLWNWADTSRDSGLTDDEHAFEIFYKLQLTGSVYIQPDFQYITGPGGDSSRDDAFVGVLRIGVNF